MRVLLTLFAILTAFPAAATTIRYDIAATWASGDRPFVEKGADIYYATPRHGYVAFDSTTMRGVQSCNFGDFFGCSDILVSSFDGTSLTAVMNMGGQMGELTMSDSGGLFTYISDVVWLSDPADSSSRAYWSARMSLTLTPVAPSEVPLPASGLLLIAGVFGLSRVARRRP